MCECAELGRYAIKTMSCSCIITDERFKQLFNQWTRILLPDYPFDGVLVENYSKVLNLIRVNLILTEDEQLSKLVAGWIEYYHPDSIEQWEFCHVGCGTMVPTVEFAQALEAFPQGYDLADRMRSAEKYLHHKVLTHSDMLTFLSPNEMKVIIVSEMTSLMPDPEALMLHLILALEPGGYLFMTDHDCRSWPDSYYLDLWHMVTTEVRYGRVHPTYGHRSRQHWRRWFEVQGMKRLQGTDPKHLFMCYLDVYVKAIR